MPALFLAFGGGGADGIAASARLTLSSTYDFTTGGAGNGGSSFHTRGSTITCSMKNSGLQSARIANGPKLWWSSSIHKIGTRGAHQSFELLERAPNYAARLAALKLAF